MFQSRQKRTLPTNDRPTGPDSMTDEVVRTTSCGAHNGPSKTAGEYCYDVEGLSGRRIQGICDYRAKRAGFNHPISAEALRGRIQPKY